MHPDYHEVRSIAQVLISGLQAKGAIITSELITDQVKKAMTMNLEWAANVEIEILVRDLESIFSTWIGVAKTLTDPDDAHVPWLDKKRSEIDWKYWDRYRDFLLRQGWSDKTVQSIDESSDFILNQLTNPEQEGSWDRRGMVVGHVQSGKTAQYIGLINKAADAGYKMIVVLAGMHKSLRSQTQVRLDEGFLGYDKSATVTDISSAMKVVGVGRINPSIKPDTITSRLDDGDFKKNVAKTFGINPGGNPLLFVIKKNGSVLRNLLDYVEWASNSRTDDDRPLVSGVPLLVIDDEADYGSIDTKDIPLDENGKPDEDHNPTVLNQRIRKLLYLFDQSAYIGYTATPFANIFIHEKAKTKEHGEDLFPRSFIMALPAPSNYIGPARLFGIDRDDTEQDDSTAGLPIIRNIEDHAATLDSREREGWMPPRHNRHHVPLYNGIEKVPPSLQTAIHSFILVCAARMSRKAASTAHNSMLIHVTRYNDVQERVYQQVQNELQDIQRRINYGEGRAPTKLINVLQELWKTDFAPVTSGLDEPDCPALPWKEISKNLKAAALSIQVKQINGLAGDSLDYQLHDEDGLNVIAIGGDKLSRGLTLEGLSVSYFLRASRMYDTLMQMGRWFGYRPGYLDLCRLFTTPDLRIWFQHIAEASEELREEFDRMVASRSTPRQYGQRVLSHGYLLVTSQVKMRHGTEVDLSFDGSSPETIVFHRNEERIEKNYQAVTQLLDRLDRSDGMLEENPERLRPGGRHERWAASLLWTGISYSDILRFLGDYQVHPNARKVNNHLIAQYIEAQLERGYLTDWSVFVIAGDSKKFFECNGYNVPLVTRAWHPPLEDQEEAERRIIEPQHPYTIRRLLSPRDESVDLSEEEYREAVIETQKRWTKDPGRSEKKKPERPGGPDIRYVRPEKKGLLLIYPLDPTDKSEKGNAGKPIMGFGFSFPSDEYAKKVKYIVNNIYYQQEYGAE